MTTTSVFPGAVDQFQHWVDGVTEVTAAPLNHINDAIEAAEAAALLQFGPSAALPPQTSPLGVVTVSGEIQSSVGFTTVQPKWWLGLQPYFDGSDSHFDVTFRWPYRLASVPSVTPTAAVYASGTPLNGTAELGWTVSVLFATEDGVICRVTKADNQADVSAGGYAVGLVYAVSL